MLDVQGLTVRYGELTVVSDVSFSVAAGDFWMIAGPNGAGKSTIIGALSRGVPYAGRVLLDGVDVKRQKARALARAMGVLMQHHFVHYAYTVEEVVALGRYAYARGPLAARSAEDAAQIEAALEATGMAALRHQPVTTLSGGELQRTFLAQVFAQNPRILLLDEPTNHLDLPYQMQTFALIKAWLKTPGRAVICVVHDLSLARAYGTRALLISGGKAIAQGEAADVLSRANLQAAYGMDVVPWMRGLYGQWGEG